MERPEVLSEQLDLDGTRVPGQVIENVLKHLHEFHANLGEALLDALAQIGDDGVDRLRAAIARPEPHHDIASVQLGRRRRPELGAQAAGERLHAVRS